MQLKMWMYDLAREQSPTLDHLYQIAALTQEAGFNALGLYLEHRFAYPSTPWSHGKGCVTPEMVKRLQAEFPSLKIVPFINLLGHFEGFLYTEHGKRYREELFNGLQACPAIPEFVELCKMLIDDTCEIFSSDLIHIGGDETMQLGANAQSKARMAELLAERGLSDQPQQAATDKSDRAIYEGAAKETTSADGKALLYGAHFGPLAEYVVSKGRRPGVWGDMFVEHPEALEFLPKSTLIFEWQYFNGIAETAKQFVEKGFEVVGSPAIQTYNATWMHVEASENNVREVAQDVRDMGLFGVCVTTWECGLFGTYDSIFPAIKACGQMLNGNDGSFYAAYAAESPAHEQWARMMSEQLIAFGGTFTPGKIRSSLKCRLLLYGNPFLCWMHHAEEFTENDKGKRIVDMANFALQVAPEECYKAPTIFLRSAVEFTLLAEAARLEYAYGHVEASVAKLATTRQLFDDLAKYARWSHERIGGSLADIERCRVAKEHVETVIKRIRQYGDGSLGYLPAWEVITNHKFMPHDQACWWLINKWANQ